MPFFGGGSDPGTAKRQMQQENQYGADFSGRGAGAWNALFPTVMQDVTNPQGFSAAEKATMNTAAGQSLGGSMSAATGQAGLMAERTKNPGAYGSALDAAAKHGQEVQSGRALGVEEASANLAHQKQQRAIQELGSLYGTNVKGLSEMMGAANQALGIYEKAKESQGSVLSDIAQIGKVGASAAGDIAGGIGSIESI